MADDRDHDGGRDENGAERVELGVQADLSHPVDFQRKRLGLRSGGENTHDVFVERERERHQGPRDNRRHEIGHDDLPERLQRRRAEIHRRLLEKRIEALQPRLHTHEHEGKTEGRVRDHQRREAEWQIEELNKENQKAHAHQHLGHHHRNENQKGERALVGETVAVEHPRADRSEKRGKQGREERDEEAVLKRRDENLVREKRLIPLRGKSLPADVELRGIERKNDQ